MIKYVVRELRLNLKRFTEFMPEPTVSIILPAYNASEYLQRAIDSLLDQTYTDFELLIIDDGSSDSTWEIISSNRDPRISGHRFQKNQGLISALNYGLGQAKGEFIARMDSDDIALPTKLEKQISFLEKNIEYCACGTSIINFDGKVSSYMRYPKTHEEIVSNLFLFERNICHPTVVIRSKVIHENNIKYRSEYLHAEDYTLWIDLAKFGKLYNLEEGLLKYNRHDAQVSSKHYDAQIQTSRKIVKELLLENFRESLSENDISTHLDFLIHPLNKSSKAVAEKDIRNWKDKLLQSNRTHEVFDEKCFNNTVTYKYFHSCFYYRFPLKHRLGSLISLIRNDPKFGLQTLWLLVKRLLFYRVFNKAS